MKGLNQMQTSDILTSLSCLLPSNVCSSLFYNVKPAYDFYKDNLNESVYTSIIDIKRRIQVMENKIENGKKKNSAN